jgi:hypothetical protein
MNGPFTAGERFLLAEARLLERRLFATCFRDAPAAGVIDVLRGFQNDDGGFGHGLEPDKRCPDSLPIDVEIAFQACATAGAADQEMLGRACDYLARTAATVDAGGAVPLAFPVIESYPRAAHWTEWTYEPGLNPTAGLVGLLYRLGFEHPWRSEATRFCWQSLESGALPDEVHALAEVLVFLEHIPERARAEEHAAVVLEHMTAMTMFHLDPEAPGYGLSPLQIAPTADSRWRTLFTDAQIDAHLDQLVQAQQPDGGWPITWDPPGAAARLEWRGIVTLQALRTLTSHGRLRPDLSAGSAAAVQR